MIKGGNATIYVTDLEAAVQFYTETLGLALNYKTEGWASVSAGPGLTLGLHPANHERAPTPGSRGAISVGFAITEPIDNVIASLKEKGVKFRGPKVDNDRIKLAFFGDPDGNALYICETPDRD